MAQSGKVNTKCPNPGRGCPLSVSQLTPCHQGQRLCAFVLIRAVPPEPSQAQGCWICSSLPGAEVLSCIFLGFLCLYAPPESLQSAGLVGFYTLSPAASSWQRFGRSGLSSPRNLPGPKCEHTLSPWPKLAVPCQNDVF